MKIHSINTNPKKLVAVSIIILLILLAFSPIVSSEYNFNDNPYTTQEDEDKELDLLRSEHYLFVNASDDVDSFYIRFAFPPDYQYQVPILFELLNDSTAEVLNYHIEDDKNEPNKVVNFTIGPMSKDEMVSIHFNYWVLVKNHEYEDLPEKVKIPKRRELPEETKIWLTPTSVVQSRSILIHLRARQLRGISNNLIRFASRVAKFTRIHRYGLFLLQLWTGTFGSQDAITTLLRNGECPGRSHLGCALFRSQKVPARVILANPSNRFWYQIHCMTEFYLPEYGWVLTEVHKGIMPYEPKNQIIVRICYPEDEEDTHPDFFFQRMDGIEYWFWIDEENVSPCYKDLVEGSKSNMFIESEVFTDSFTAEFAFFMTKAVFHQYEYYLGMNLTGENLDHFQNATGFQKQAIDELIDYNPDDYIYYIDRAYDEYKLIDL